MENMYIDIREQGTTLSNYFRNRDFVSVEELLSTLEEVIDDFMHLREEFKDFEREVEDNYRYIPAVDQYEI